eukprot:6669384-Lingulodinium_polyedra.AAC.1
MWHRTLNGTGSRASLPKRPTATRVRWPATGARLAGPADAHTPRSLKVVAAGTPPPSSANHLRSEAAFAHRRLLE